MDHLKAFGLILIPILLLSKLLIRAYILLKKKIKYGQDMKDWQKLRNG